MLSNWIEIEITKEKNCSLILKVRFEIPFIYLKQNINIIS